MPSSPAKIIFLDRDGVINAESAAYVKSVAEFDPLPGSIAAIARLTRAGWRIFVATNQSSVARKMITLERLTQIHQHLNDLVEAAGGRIEQIFFCPHGPDDACDCRKPNPGLLLNAQQQYGLDLANSIMIGDSLRDLQVADNAGCGAKIVVRTGYGEETLQELPAAGVTVDYVADDLADAVTWLLATYPIGLIDG